MFLVKRTGLVILIWILLEAAWLGFCFSSVELEHKIKAAFTHNFIKFVNWPNAVFQSPDSPIVISTVGTGPMATALRAIDGKVIGGRRLKVQPGHSLNDLSGSQVVFVGQSTKARMSDILNAVHSLPILTIGESDGFCKQGGMINFVIVDNSVHFEINVRAIKSSSIRVSYKLMKQGIIVE